jgi:SAM-dependent methyltransferase
VTRWTDLADDPTDAAVVAQRRALIDGTRRPPVTDRLAYLSSLARGRRVLDVGVVDHTLESTRSWLHGAVSGVASYCLGVDVVAPEVERLRDRGFNVERMDITAGERPDDTFDVIICGEVVEHLGSPGGLFDAGADLLTADGRLVLTTPSPYALWRVFQNVRGRPIDNVDHVTLLTAWGLAELAARSGLVLDRYCGVAARANGAKARAMQYLVLKRVVPFVPEAVCESVIYEFVRDTAPAGADGPAATSS